MGVDAEMFVTLNREVSNDELKRASYIFGSAFHHLLWIGNGEKIDNHPLERHSSDAWPKIQAQTVLRIPLLTRYYGIGYERGPLFNYIMMAELLEKLFPDCQVHYGGDSSGVEIELFDKAKRNEMIEHFAKVGHDAYNRYFDKDKIGPQCPVCDVQMIQNGWGPKYKRFNCLGCGWIHVERNDEVIKGFDIPYR